MSIRRYKTKFLYRLRLILTPTTIQVTKASFHRILNFETKKETQYGYFFFYASEHKAIITLNEKVKTYSSYKLLYTCNNIIKGEESGIII